MAMMEEEAPMEGEHMMEEEEQTGSLGYTVIAELEGQAGISASDIKKMRDAGFQTVESVRGAAR